MRSKIWTSGRHHRLATDVHARMAEYGTDRTRYFGVNSDAGAYPECHHVASVAAQLSPVEGSASGLVLPPNLERTGVKRVGGTLIRREVAVTCVSSPSMTSNTLVIYIRRSRGSYKTTSGSTVLKAATW